MDVAELVRAHDEAQPAQAARALDWLEPAQVTVTRPARRTHRSDLALALLHVLFADLHDRVPSARAYVQNQVGAGRRIVFDHGAIRTVAWPTSSPLPPGTDQVRRLLEPLGWRHANTYPLPKLKMTGGSWTHLDAPESIGQWFVSEFHPDDFSPGFRRTVEEVTATAIDPVDAAAAEALDELSTTSSVGDDAAVALLAVLTRCFTRLHDMPTLVQYRRLLDESPEMAWIATEGTSFNHATDRVPDVEATAAEERISGRPIKETIEVSRSGTVRQTAHRAAMVERVFDVDGVTETMSVPGSFFEFIDRAEQPDGGLDLSFDTSNAQGIFAMTRRDGTDDDRAPGPITLDTTATCTPGARIVSRPALTFKVRRRQLSAKRQREFDEWIGRWSIPLDGPIIDWAEVFDGHTEVQGRGVVLDIGFGHGESTIRMAHAQPDLDVVGVEVHDPGVMAVLDAIENDPLPNVRVVHGDVIRFLRRIGPESLRAVRIFFPDPWKKHRQHHRRLVWADTVGALTDRLEVGGELHLATDISDYAEQMQRVCDGESRLVGGVVRRPDERPLTRFEQRGLDEGRDPTDLVYRRTAPGSEQL